MIQNFIQKVKRFYPAVILIGLLFIVYGCAASINSAGSPGQVSSNNPSNYPELDQYGQWFNVPPYGEVWQPYVLDMSSWQPFYHGQWDWTNYGWTWISYEPYGWLVYHYGYWDFQPDVGWFWIPGDEWSPARVEWMEYGNYVGWAPFPPPGVTWPDPWNMGRINCWTVVDFNNFASDHIGRYRLSHPPRWDESRPFIRHAPDVHNLEYHIGRQVPPIHINREPVQSVRRHYERMRLPKAEERRIEKERQQVQRKVLSSKPAQRKGKRKATLSKRSNKERPQEKKENSERRPVERNHPKRN